MPRRLPALPVTRLRQGTRRMGPDGAVLQLHPRAEHPRPGQVHGLLGQASFKLGDFAAQYRRSRRRPPADRQAAAPSQNQPKRSSYPPRVQLRSVNLAGNIFLPSLASVIRRSPTTIRRSPTMIRGGLRLTANPPYPPTL